MTLPITEDPAVPLPPTASRPLAAVRTAARLTLRHLVAAVGRARRLLGHHLQRLADDSPRWFFVLFVAWTALAGVLAVVMGCWGVVVL